MSSNVLKKILEEIIDFINPFILALQDERALYYFFSSMGWRLNEIRDYIGGDFKAILDAFEGLSAEMEALVKYLLDILDKEDSVQDIESFIVETNKVSSTLNSIRNLSELSQSLSSYSSISNEIKDVPTDILNFLFISYIYNRSQKVYYLFLLLGVIKSKDEETVEETILGNTFIFRIKNKLPYFDFQAFVNLLTKPKETFLNEYFPDDAFENLSQVNETSYKLFSRIGLFLSSFDLFLNVGDGYLGPISDSKNINGVDVKRKNGLLSFFKKFSIHKEKNGGFLTSFATFAATVGLIEKDNQEFNGTHGLFIIPSGELNLNIQHKRLSYEFTANLVPSPTLFYSQGLKVLGNSSLSNIDFSLLVSLLKYTHEERFILFGVPDKTRLDISDFSVNGRLNWSENQQVVNAVAHIKDLNLVIKTDKQDGFLSKILPKEGIKTAADIDIGYSNLSGFYFGGSGGFEIVVAKKIALGPVTIENVMLALKFKGGNSGTDKSGLIISISADIGAKLEVLNAAIQGLGLQAGLNFSGNGTGNLGVVDLNPSFKPPTGAGLSLKLAVVKLGGFLSIKPDEGEYFGAIEIEIVPISLRIVAIGLINTKWPNGEKIEGGFSLLMIITAEFMPIQIGFGFSLVGLGGLFGYNRTINTDRLRTGLHQGTLNSILFPKNVVANINRIVSDIKEVFPIRAGQFVIGPMIKIGWGGLPIVTAELGVIIELPNPVRVAIAGIIAAKLPKPDPDLVVVVLQLHFLGMADFEKKLLSFDASLVDSRILTMTITGDFALRIGWGNPGMFILSSGGFHPDFKEAPVELQQMKRLGITIIDRENIKIWADSYFAITTNTVQFGAHVNLNAKFSSYALQASAGMDALMQFYPFQFSLAMGMMARLTGPAVDIVIDVYGSLTGPNPWHITGQATAKIGPFDLNYQLDATFGDENPPEVEQAFELVLPLFKAEIEKASNWKAIGGFNTSGKITLRSSDPNATEAIDMVLHPDSTLAFSQRLVPLDMEIQKFGKNLVGDTNKIFKITGIIAKGAQGAQDVTLPLNDQLDRFVPGNFIEIPSKDGNSEAAQLAYPSFVEFNSGKAVSLAATQKDLIKQGKSVPKPVNYECYYIQKKVSAKIKDPVTLPPDLFGQFSGASAAAKSALSLGRTKPSPAAPDTIVRNKAQYQVVNTTDLTPLGKDSYSNHVEAYLAQSKLGHADKQNSLIISTLE